MSLKSSGCNVTANKKRQPQLLDSANGSAARIQRHLHAPDIIVCKHIDTICAALLLQGADLRRSLSDVVGPQLFRLSFAFGAVALIVQGGPAFRRRLASAQPEVLRLARRVGVAVQLLVTSSAQHTQVRQR